ncbi:MAG TPA: hypothetical protein VK779_08670 [Rhizomicrobium sp.]|nr:hypothetical protein [Rhizomicrobium sp.]
MSVSKSAILCAALLLAGCASGGSGSSNLAPTASSDTTKPDEGSPAYVMGFSDGCATSNPRYRKQNNLTAKRDEAQYNSDNNYHKGWDKGYLSCEDKIDSGGLPIPGNSVIL